MVSTTNVSPYANSSNHLLLEQQQLHINSNVTQQYKFNTSKETTEVIPLPVCKDPVIEESKLWTINMFVS